MKRATSKVLSLLLAAAMLLSLMPLSALAGDVDDHWAAPYIERKFAFLEGEFKYYQLERDIEENHAGKVRILPRQISNRIASGV